MSGLCDFGDALLGSVVSLRVASGSRTTVRGDDTGRTADYCCDAHGCVPGRSVEYWADFASALRMVVHTSETTAGLTFSRSAEFEASRPTLTGAMPSVAPPAQLAREGSVRLLHSSNCCILAAAVSMRADGTIRPLAGRNPRSGGHTSFGHNCNSGGESDQAGVSLASSTILPCYDCGGDNLLKGRVRGALTYGVTAMLPGWLMTMALNRQLI